MGTSLFFFFHFFQNSKIYMVPWRTSWVIPRGPALGEKGGGAGSSVGRARNVYRGGRGFDPRSLLVGSVLPVWPEVMVSLLGLFVADPSVRKPSCWRWMLRKQDPIRLLLAWSCWKWLVSSLVTMQSSSAPTVIEPLLTLVSIYVNCGINLGSSSTFLEHILIIIGDQ